ncbi:MAG: hypothetical protein DMG65_22520 [Candidatus Angelobacter sp. Gp1-AA117]|nr:MAG: hypothetical protein DMG65_22520 [Candidatus Angelobacter sp. Gp1-AA117]
MGSQPMDIAIFGAGIAGLMAAITLGKQGHSCRLYERSREAHDAGMGFILMPEAILYLHSLGVNLSGEFSGIPLHRYLCRNAQGEVLYEEVIPKGSRSFRRRDLMAALVNALPADSPIIFNSELEWLDFGDGGRISAAILRSGTRVTAELFIAADGTRSRAREVLFPDWPTRSAQVIEVVGLARCSETLRWAGNNLNKFHSPDGGLAVGVLPVDKEHVVWFVQVDTARFAPPPAKEGNALSWYALVRKLTRGWAHPAPHLLAMTDPDQIHIWRPIDADVVPYFHQQNLVLAGDAAHPFSPFTSQGVASAIADAVALADALETWTKSVNGHLAKALANYSKERHQQCEQYLVQGRELAQKFLAPISETECWLPLAT